MKGHENRTWISFFGSDLKLCSKIRGHEYDLYLINVHKKCRINSLTFRGPKYWKLLPN